MPVKKRKYAKKNSKSRKRRKFSRRPVAKYKKRRRGIPRGIPSKMFVKLRYVQRINLDPTADPGVQICPNVSFRANSINEPYSSISSSGASLSSGSLSHQPRWHDQYAGFYERYMVLGSQCRMFVNDEAQASKQGVRYFIVLNQDEKISTRYVDQDYLWERKQNRSRMLMTGSNGLTPYIYGGMSPRVAKLGFSAKKEFDFKDYRDKRTDLSGIMGDLGGTGTNPNKQAYFQCCATGVGEHLLDPGEFTFTVVIDYVAELYEDRFNKVGAS